MVNFITANHAVGKTEKRIVPEVKYSFRNSRHVLLCLTDLYPPRLCIDTTSGADRE